MKTYMPKTTIFRKIMVPAVLFVAFSVGLFTYLSVKSESAIERRAIISDGRYASRFIASSVENAFWSLNWIYVEQMLSETIRFMDDKLLYALVVKSGGEVYLASEQGHQGKIIDSSLLHDRETLVEEYYFPEKKVTGMLLVNPVAIGNEKWHVILGLSLDPIHKATTAIIKRNLIPGGAFLLLGAVFVYILSRSISRPVTELARGVRKISSDDLNLEVRTNADDEIGLLEHSFRWMLRGLNEAQARLKEYSAGLEKKVEERTRELRRKEERLELALRGGDLGTWSWDIRTGEVRFNERWATMKGYSLDEIKPHLSSWERLVHPEDLPGVLEKINAHFEGKTPSYEAEFRMRHKSGEWVWILDKGKVIEWDADDNPTRACGTHLDITERKQAEEALRESEAQKQAILDASIDMTMLMDTQMRIVWVNKNAADLANKKSEDLIGHVCYEFFQDTGKPCPGCPLEKAMKTGKMERTTMCHPAMDTVGESYWDNYAVPVKDDSGRITGAIEIARDITERKRAEEDLKKAQSELLHTEKLASLGQLAAGIAHEINTPSQFVGDNIKFLQDAHKDLHKLISSFTELLSSVKQGRVSDGLVRDVEEAVEEADLEFLFEEIPKAIEQSQEGVQRIGHIVRSMKQFSHPGSKDKTLADINECIETTLTVCRNEWKYAAGMVTDLDRSAPLVPLYQNEFNQVILNIILNAAQAIKEKTGESDKEKGTITITTGHDEKFVEVRIRDTGTGIPEDIREKIFDPFFTSREVGKGTGQGLAISRSVIVEKHGGALSFETEEGKGTTFVIRLPFAPDNADNQKKEAR